MSTSTNVITNVVTSGTAVTDLHLARLRRLDSLTRVRSR